MEQSKTTAEAKARGPARAWALLVSAGAALSRRQTLARALLFLAVLGGLQLFTWEAFNARSARPGLWSPTYEYWDRHGFFATGGLIYFKGQGYAHLQGWHAPRDEYGLYRNAPAGSLAPVQLLRTVARALTGTAPDWLEGLWGLLMVTLGATLLSLLCWDVLRAQGFADREASLLALLPGAAYLSFAPILNVAAYVEPTTVGINLLIGLAFLLNRLSAEPAARARGLRGIAVLSFCWASVDMPPMPVFFLAAAALSLALSRDLGLEWPELGKYLVAPVAAALGLFVLQQLFASLSLDMDWTGSNVLYRMGLSAGSKLGHEQVFTYAREGRYQWKWPFEVSVAALVLTVGWHELQRRKEQGQLSAPTASFGRALALVLVMALVYVLEFAVFSNHVIMHPSMFDPYAYLPCLLAAFVLLASALRRIGFAGPSLVHLYVALTALLVWSDWQKYVANPQL